MESYEEIRRQDLKRQNERRDLLKDLISGEFPDAMIFVAPDDPWRIRVEVDIPRTAALVFQPSDPVMMDVANNFERIFKNAIQYARQILDNPPRKDIYQGKIHLSNNGISFELYK